MKKILPSWLMKLGFRRAHLVTETYDAFDANDVKPASFVHPEDANLITSETPSGRHIVQLDLDVTHYYIPSSTEGHGHLYINAELTKSQYEEVLECLARNGIIQRGYVDSFKNKGYTALRVPGLTKADQQGNIGLVKDDVPTKAELKLYQDNAYSTYTDNIKHGKSIDITEYNVGGPIDSGFTINDNLEKINQSSYGYNVDWGLNYIQSKYSAAGPLWQECLTTGDLPGTNGSFVVQINPVTLEQEYFYISDDGEYVVKEIKEEEKIQDFLYINGKVFNLIKKEGK